ncbi:MAG: gamma-glutamyl-gamma-aminobutyrate hydrolase family protein [Candidatus Saccharicenans sp.]
MKRNLIIGLFLVLGLTLFLMPGALPAPQEEIRLTVFYPSIGTVRNLQALREKGFIPISNLKVTGVYHVKEATNYEETKRYVTENKIDWFAFHPVSAEVNEKNLYQPNPALPEFEEILKNSDGIIFFGGPDIPPAVYQEKTSLLTMIEDPYRHYFECSAIFHLLGGYQDEKYQPLLEKKPNLPILGICLGAQSLNVGTGGTLIQDIWTEVYGKQNVEDIIALGPDCWHNNPYVKLFPLERLSAYNFHWIKLLPDGFFVRVLGFSEKDRPRILSSHHQAIDKLGRGFKVVALSPDGKIVEAIHHTKYPNVLGIQFHPENYRLWDDKLAVRQKPEDSPGSYWDILKNNPPSLDFHQKIWKWFSDMMVRAHRRAGKS